MSGRVVREDVLAEALLDGDHVAWLTRGGELIPDEHLLHGNQRPCTRVHDEQNRCDVEAAQDRRASPARRPRRYRHDDITAVDC